eukprot:3939143-Rhodomonas_salina.8
MTPSLGLEASAMGKLPQALCIIENHDLAEHAVAWFIEAGSTMVAEETAQKFGPSIARSRVSLCARWTL